VSSAILPFAVLSQTGKYRVQLFRERGLEGQIPSCERMDEAQPMAMQKLPHQPKPITPCVERVTDYRVADG
jgi:hypothetical protein